MTEVLVADVARGRKPKGQGQDRRREILDAAREIYLNEGYEQTTIRRVGEKVGVSSTALYVYFKDKDALIHEVCEEMMAPLQQAALDGIEAVANAKSADQITELLHRLGEAYIRFGLANPQVYVRMFMTEKCGPGSWDHRRGVRVSQDGVWPGSVNVFGFAADLIRKGQSFGLYRDGDPEDLAEVAWALLHGLVAIRITDPKAPYAPVETHIKLGLGILKSGLAKD